MADNKQENAEDEPTSRLWHRQAGLAPDAYVNTVHTDIGQSEISVLFGINDPLYQQETGKPIVRLVMTHDNFVKIMGFLNSRVDFLKHAYGGQTPSLEDDPSRTRQAFPLLSGRPVDPAQEGSRE